MHPTLVFTSDASRLIVRNPDGIDIVDIAGRVPPIGVRAEAIEQVLTVRDQIWLVEGGAMPSLRRLSLAGEPIGDRLPLWGDGRLIRTATGNGALWTATPPAVLVPADDRFDRIVVPGEGDLILPVSPTRWLVCKRDRLVLREPTSERWRSGAFGWGRALDGTILFEGRSAALVTDDPTEPRRQLVVVGLHEPVVQHRMTLAQVDLVRFAPLRGYAALLAGRRRLLIVDLRFGRVLRDHDWGADIDDLAIDDSAQHIALRQGDEIVQVAIRDVLAARPPVAPPPDDEAVEPVHEVAVIERAVSRTPVEEQAPSETPFHQGATLGAVAALLPRPNIDPTSAAESLHVVERYRTLVTALAGRAIALAWDEGRLTYPNEGNLPFRSEVEGLLGRATGHAADEVRIAQAEVDDAIAAVRAAESAAAPRIAPLLALAREFGLSPLARQIVIVIAAPSLWGGLARLYGIVANDEGRPLCDELLICQLLGPRTNPFDVARELDRDAPLIRYGIVRPGDGRMRPFVALTVEPLVMRMLRGAREGDLDGVEIVPASVGFDELLIPAPLKQEIAELVATTSSHARLVVRGRASAGRHTLLATLAAAANRRLGVIDAAPIMRELKTRGDQLRTAMRRAHLMGMLPCIDGLETIASDDQAARDTVRELLRDHPGPLAVRLPWDARPPLDIGYLSIDLPQLTIDQRLTVWHTALDTHHLYVRDPVELATRYSVGPGATVRACASVASTHVASDPPRDVAPELEVAVRRHLESRLGSSASRVTRLATWSQVVLPPDIQDSLLELIARIKHRRTVFDVWGFDTVMSTSRGVTALFQGGPGTGKTLVASAIANELGMDLYRVDLSRVMSKWIGETEQNLAKLFDAAEDGHAIILFDEADSLFAKRTEVRTSVDRYANLEVNYLLQRLDSFEGIAILTTNFGTSIDQAFRRRLSFRLTFPFPDEEMREQLWRAHLPPDMPVAGDFDLATLARRYRMSGGYIRNATLRAAFLAAEEHTPLTQEHLERAIRAEFREIGKLADSGMLE